MTLGLFYYAPYPSLNRIEVVVVSSLLHYTHIYIHLSSLVMYLKRGANQRLSSLLRLLLRLLPQNFYMAPYLERGQEESSPIGINGHSTLERKATKPFSKSTFWPYVCVCAWKHLPVMLGQIGELVKVVSDSPSSILVTMTAPRGELPHCDAGGRFGHLILISLYKYVYIWVGVRDEI